MAENTSRLVKKIAKAGITLGLCLLPVVSNGQKVKEDINWTKVKEPYGKYTLTIRSTNSLPELSKYQTNHKEPYLPYGNLNLPYEYNYKLPQDSIKGDVSNYLKKIDVCPDCTKIKKSVSIKKKSQVKLAQTKKVPTKPITPQKTTVVPVNRTPEKKTEEPYVPKTSENEKPSTIYNVNETNTTNNTTNNYYGDTTRNKLDTIPKRLNKSGLELRALIEGSKTVNPLNSPFWGASINPQLGKGSIWFGPYATVGFGKESKFVSTPVYNKILLSQANQFFHITEGIREESSELYCPIEFGGILSINSKDNRVRFNVGYGFVKETNSTNGVSESGTDYLSLGDEIIEEKPYFFEIEKGKTYKNWVPTQKIGVDVEPFKKAGFYLGAEAQHRGKVDSKMKGINFNIKAGWRFGGGKR